MSTIVEKIYADCALNQAPEYLERFFAVHGHGTNGEVVLPLRAPLEIAGFKGEMGKMVTFELTKLAVGKDMIPKMSLRWRPDSGPFPEFEGVLSVEADADYSGCAIALRGHYNPPFGIAGKTFDAAVGRQIARATARELLERIRDFVEAQYEETEREKIR